MSKSKGKSKEPKTQQVWKYYQVEKTGIKRIKKECPRCKGSFLAEHKNRRHCGTCGYTEFKTKGT
ncbi:MAG: 30S ribosomal protein S27ae [Candidatus Heimdallarchaeota archaeon]|nr:30S ribosomal protein S27ae [Candidatus Heimdallarchaeota archaeon]